MRIGIDIRNIGKNRTGSETVVFYLVKNLVKIDKENEYFLYTDNDDRGFLSKLKKILKLVDCPNFKVVPVLPKSKFIRTMFALPAKAKKDRLDVLNVEYISPLFLNKKIKLITTIHDVSFERYPKFISYKDLFFLKILIPLSLRRANGILAVSKFTAKEIAKFYPFTKGKIFTILNGGAGSEFFEKQSDESLVAFRKAKKLKNDYIFYVGTLQSRKNVSFLIENYEKFCLENFKNNLEKAPDLVIGGNRSGHNYDKKIDFVVEKLKKNNRKIFEKVRFLGFVDKADLPSYFKSASVFVFPSKYEGFGLPIIEAMASEAPVLCSDSSCFKEIAGDGAVLYKEDDSADFLLKLKKLYFDKDWKSKIVAKGKIRSKKFSWEKTAKETLELFKSISA